MESAASFCGAAAAFGLAGILAVGGCGRDAPVASTVPEGPRSLVLIALDDVRYDRAGLEGEATAKMPAMKAFAALPGSVTLTSAYAPATFSQASYASLFTGRDAPMHGAGFAARPLGSDATTLAEALHAYGYRTAAFTGGAQVSRVAGLHQGFTTFRESAPLSPLALQVTRALAWLDEHAADPEPLFLFVHGYGAHIPYAGPLGEMYDPAYDGPLHGIPDALGMVGLTHVAEDVMALPGRAPLALSAADKTHIAAHYDGAVRYEDYHLARLLRELDARGILDRSLVVVMSDHGEELGEYGAFRHGPAITEEVLHVPVVVRFPEGGAPRAWDGVLSLTDLAPTLLDYLGVVPPASIEGEDLLDAIRGGGAPEPRIARAASGCCYAVRTPEWLLSGLLTDGEPVWTLFADGKGDDRAAARPEVVAELKAALKRWPATPGHLPGAEKPAPDPALLEQVRKAGYWNGPAGDVDVETIR